MLHLHARLHPQAYCLISLSTRPYTPALRLSNKSRHFSSSPSLSPASTPGTMTLKVEELSTSQIILLTVCFFRGHCRVGGVG